MTQTPPKPIANSRLPKQQDSDSTLSLDESILDAQITDSLLPRSTTSNPAPPRSKEPLLQWFYNLPISRKQVVALIACEIISVLGIVIGNRLIITRGLQAELRSQAESELAVTKINYNIKVNQMGFGFRGQSDNETIIAAAKSHATGQPLNPALQNQVRQVLQNEISSRNIEYATLVGKDLRIIVNANRNRQGELFNPNNLVQTVLKDPKQLKVNAVVSANELTKESPPLPANLQNQDALIRYTLTPVKDPADKTVIGVLVSGDVVTSSKSLIIEDTLRTLKAGYGAIYWRNSQGKFTLATALAKAEDESLDRAQSQIELPDTSLLTSAIKEPANVQMEVAGKTYTLAAEALPNISKQEADGSVSVANSGEPIAFLVRGTPQTILDRLLNQSLLEEIVVLSLALLLIGIWAIILRRAIVIPIERLKQITQEFTKGNQRVRANVSSTDELGQLAVTFNQMADSIVSQDMSLQEQTRRKERYAKQTQLFVDVGSHHAGQFEDLEPIFNQAVEGAREILNADRVIVYLFNNLEEPGYIAAESVLSGWPSALGNTNHKLVVEPQLLDAYKNGLVVPTNNVFEAGLDSEQLKSLERLKVKASLVTPVQKNEQLFGLLIAHHCSAPHDWQ